MHLVLFSFLYDHFEVFLKLAHLGILAFGERKNLKNKDLIVISKVKYHAHPGKTGVIMTLVLPSDCKFVFLDIFKCLSILVKERCLCSMTRAN